MAEILHINGLQSSRASGNAGSSASCEVEVWAQNFEEEFKKMLELTQKGFTLLFMDTEFPGNVTQNSSGHYSQRYSDLRKNVNVTSLIQLGITLFSPKGHRPDKCTFQFHFRYILDSEPNNPTSIELLKHSGINFDRLARDGIPHVRFAEAFIPSGLCLQNSRVWWVTYHGSSDFAYLVKVLNGFLELPPTQVEYMELFRKYFPQVLDVKVLAEHFELHGGLQSLADRLNLSRIGQQHLAGSDSRLTGDVFFEIYKSRCPNEIPPIVRNRVHGYEADCSSSDEYEDDSD